jgi:Putative binding domain, N-terminal
VSYIPETAWNESSTVAGGSGLWAGGGGASVIYNKPGWQTGSGVPAANHRYVPDVALTSAGHDGYLVYMNGQFYAFAGTSAATPSFAGVVALAVQRQGKPQGNVNPTLYTLGVRQASGAAAVFHDTTAGNNSVKGVMGYSAGVGYDQATGLGSVDGNLLVNSWASGATAIPSFQVSAPAAGLTVTQGATASLKVTVAVSGGFNAAITLSAGSLPSGLVASFSPATLAAPGSGQSTLTLTAGAQLAAGNYNVVVSGAGGNLNQTLALAVTVASKCSYSLSPASAEQPPAAASYGVAVTATAGCAWTASSNASWVTVTGGASGTGTGQVAYSLAANTGAARTGTLTIAGLTFQVVQDSPNFAISPAAASVAGAGGNGAVAVLAPSPKSAWTAKSNATWITITSAASGAGSASVAYSAAANTAAAARTGTLTIAGLTFTVTQMGVTCTYGLKLGAPTSATGGFTASIAVATAAGCGWTATSNASWITIKSGASGTGNGTVTFVAANNPATGARTGTMTVAGYTVTVTEGARTAVRIGRPLGAFE